MFTSQKKAGKKKPATSSETNNNKNNLKKQQRRLTSTSSGPRTSKRRGVEPLSLDESLSRKLDTSHPSSSSPPSTTTPSIPISISQNVRTTKKKGANGGSLLKPHQFDDSTQTASQLASNNASTTSNRPNASQTDSINQPSPGVLTAKPIYDAFLGPTSMASLQHSFNPDLSKSQLYELSTNRFRKINSLDLTSTPKSVTGQQLLNRNWGVQNILSFLRTQKVANMVVFDTSGQSPTCDYTIICNVASVKPMQALTSKIVALGRMNKAMGYDKFSSGDDPDGLWNVATLGHVVVHVLTPIGRTAPMFQRVERRLLVDAKLIPVGEWDSLVDPWVRQDQELWDAQARNEFQEWDEKKISIHDEKQQGHLYGQPPPPGYYLRPNKKSIEATYMETSDEDDYNYLDLNEQHMNKLEFMKDLGYHDKDIQLDPEIIGKAIMGTIDLLPIGDKQGEGKTNLNTPGSRKRASALGTKNDNGQNDDQNDDQNGQNNNNDENDENIDGQNDDLPISQDDEAPPHLTQIKKSRVGGEIIQDEGNNGEKKILKTATTAGKTAKTTTKNTKSTKATTTTTSGSKKPTTTTRKSKFSTLSGSVREMDARMNMNRSGIGFGEEKSSSNFDLTNRDYSSTSSPSYTTTFHTTQSSQINNNNNNTRLQKNNAHITQNQNSTPNSTQNIPQNVQKNHQNSTPNSTQNLHKNHQNVHQNSTQDVHQNHQNHQKELQFKSSNHLHQQSSHLSRLSQQQQQQSSSSSSSSLHPLSSSTRRHTTSLDHVPVLGNFDDPGPVLGFDFMLLGAQPSSNNNNNGKNSPSSSFSKKNNFSGNIPSQSESHQSSLSPHHSHSFSHRTTNRLSHLSQLSDDFDGFDGFDGSNGYGNGSGADFADFEAFDEFTSSLSGSDRHFGQGNQSGSTFSSSYGMAPSKTGSTSTSSSSAAASKNGLKNGYSNHLSHHHNNNHNHDHGNNNNGGMASGTEWFDDLGDITNESPNYSKWSFSSSSSSSNYQSPFDSLDSLSGMNYIDQSGSSGSVIREMMSKQHQLQHQNHQNLQRSGNNLHSNTTRQKRNNHSHHNNGDDFATFGEIDDDDDGDVDDENEGIEGKSSYSSSSPSSSSLSHRHHHINHNMNDSTTNINNTSMIFRQSTIHNPGLNNNSTIIGFGGLNGLSGGIGSSSNHRLHDTNVFDEEFHFFDENQDFDPTSDDFDMFDHEISSTHPSSSSSSLNQRQHQRLQLSLNGIGNQGYDFDGHLGEALADHRDQMMFGAEMDADEDADLEQFTRLLTTQRHRTIHQQQLIQNQMKHFNDNLDEYSQDDDYDDDDADNNDDGDNDDRDLDFEIPISGRSAGNTATGTNGATTIVFTNIKQQQHQQHCV